MIGVSELSGYVGAMMFSVFLLPQIYKTWTSKSTKDLSVFALQLLLIASSCFSYYAYHAGFWPIFVKNMALFISSACLLMLVYRFRKIES